MLTEERPVALTREELEELEDIKRELGVGEDLGRPKTRADCANVPRPCPFVGCRYNTYLDVLPNGVIQYRHQGKEPCDINPQLSCALDIAESEARGTTALVVSATGMSRTTTALVLEQALAKVLEGLGLDTIDAFLDAYDESGEIV